MDQTVTFSPRLLVREPKDDLSCPQKLKIPQIIAGKDQILPATGLILVNRKYICKLYYLPEVYDNHSTAFFDTSVVLDSADCQKEVCWVEEISVLSDSIVNFSDLSVRLQLDINQLNLDVIKSPQHLSKLTLRLLKHYTFSKKCKISCNRQGISSILVTSTASSGYGTVSEQSNIVIEGISLETSSTLGRNPLGGLSRAEETLRNLITTNANYMKNPERFAFKPKCQALLIGPVGTGKTSLVHQVTRALNCILFELSSDVFQPLPGETEQAILRFFEKLKAFSCILERSQLIVLLIENIEIFCPTFNQKMKENSHTSRISSLMFALLDEISASDNPIIVIGTTSKLESVNVATRRSSRLGSCEIVLDMPNEDERLEILKVLTDRFDEELPRTEALQMVAQSTPGFVGADLELLCQSALNFLRNSEKSFQKAFEAGLRTVTPSVMRENLGLVTKSSLKFDSIGGMEALKKTLITSVLGPLRHPEKYQRLGLRCSSGILLYGPSGCAKTTIVKCLAGEAKMTLIFVSSAELYSPYVGEAEKFIVKLFNQARMNAPAIIFFDEIDTIVGNRSKSGGGNDSHMRILSTLLTEIDGFGTSDKKTVLIIGATNKPEMIDDALMRPGRFDKLIHVPAPDFDSRVSILKFITQGMPLASDIDIASLAEQTSSFSGADLVNLCNEAALNAATKDLQCDIITANDFSDVLAYLSPSLNEKQIQFFLDFEKARRQ